MERHINGNFRNDIRINLIDRIEDDSIIYLIDAFIDALIQSSPEVYKRKTLSCGRKSFDNKIYLKLYLYSYLNGYTSSRKISRECKYNLELIWLLEDLHPNYWSINNYRNKNKDLIHKMTIEFRKFLKSNVYIDDEYTAYDGSKFKANGDKAVSIESLDKRLKKYDKYKLDIISYLTNLDDEDLKDEEKEKNKLTLEDELKVIEKQEKKLIKQKEKLVFEILKKNKKK